MPRTSAAAALLLPLLLPLPLPAQKPAPSEAERTAELVRTVRRAKASREDKADAIDALMQLSWRGPHRLAMALEAEIRGLRRTLTKRDKALRKAFSKRARKLVAQRSGGKAVAEIARLREIVLKNARDKSLTKARVQSESDPAVEKLRAMLTVDVDQVFAADEDLEQDHAQVAELLEELDWAFFCWKEAHERVLGSRGDADAARAARSLRPVDQPPTSDALDAELERLAVDATPLSSSERSILEANAKLRDRIQPTEYDGILFLNRLRILLGMRPYAIDPKLCVASRGHSKDMLEHDFFSHTSPLPGKRTPGQRAALAGTSGGAENIARGARTGEAVIMQWWYSPGHHRNMMGYASRIGLGRHESFWTQMFG